MYFMILILIILLENCQESGAFLALFCWIFKDKLFCRRKKSKMRYELWKNKGRFKGYKELIIKTTGNQLWYR